MYALASERFSAVANGAGMAGLNQSPALISLFIDSIKRFFRRHIIARKKDLHRRPNAHLICKSLTSINPITIARINVFHHRVLSPRVVRGDLYFSVGWGAA